MIPCSDIFPIGPRADLGGEDPTCFLGLYLSASVSGCCSLFQLGFPGQLLLDTFHTVVSVPYFAMTPELTPDYDERTSLTAVRKIFGVSGYTAGAVATTLIASIFRENFGLTEETAYSNMGAVFGIVATITICFRH